MQIPLAYVTWKGITQHMEVQLTMMHGLEPSRTTINIPPDQNISQTGTLTILHGGNEIELVDCRADLIDVYKSSDGLMMWTVTILDRRWKWKFGQISGYYNTRMERVIKAGTEKNIKELMQLCLQSMNEEGYDLSTVPTNVFPEIEWDYELPAEALAKLCDLIGYRIVFQWSRNRVAILKQGEGRRLAQENATDFAATFDPPESPRSLRFVGNRILWEAPLALEAVAQDVDYSWKLLDDPSLSYRPEGGWSDDIDLDFGNFIGNLRVGTISGTSDVRRWAMANAFRKYRIKATSDFTKLPNAEGLLRPLMLPHPDGNTVVVNKREQLLPILRERLATYRADVVAGKIIRQQKPAVIYGQFDGMTASYLANIEDSEVASSSGGPGWLADGSPPKNMVYTGGWNIDAERGIITFSEPVFRPDYSPVRTTRKDGSSYTPKSMSYKPAILWLRTAFGVRDEMTRAWLNWEIERELDSAARTQPLYVRRPDILLSLLIDTDGAIFDLENVGREDYLKAANFYLNEMQKKLEIRDPVAVTYPYIRREELDGAIQQVTWSITNRGAFTKVSRNREEPILGYSYAEQRLFQQVSARLGDPTTARAEADKADRAPGK